MGNIQLQYWVGQKQIAEMDLVQTAQHYKQSAEKLFDKIFAYDRELKETFKYANTLKHGDYEQRLEMKEKKNEEQVMKQERQQSHHQRSIFDTLLGKSSEKDMPNIPEDRKRKKRPDQSQGLGM